MQQRPDQGVPDLPEGWLHTVASGRLVDRFRSEGARRDRAFARDVEDLPDGEIDLVSWSPRTP